MIKVSNTENLAGVSISGDYEDLENLLDALYEITIDEMDEKYSERYWTMSTRLLSLAYDVRHAMQGDREVEFVDNMIDREKMIQQEILAHIKNVHYSVNVYYPELMFEMLAINELITLRMDKICKPKNDYYRTSNKMIVWDDTISVLRMFQSQVVKAVKEVLTEGLFTRWLKVMNPRYSSMCDILNPYIDLQNISYLDMNREKREKQLSVISKRIAEYETYKEFILLKDEMEDYSMEFGVPIDNINLEGLEYPDEIDW